MLLFMGAVAFGILLGWRLFLAPERDAEPENTGQTQSPGTQAATSPTQIPVQSVGTAAAGLGRAVRVGSPAPDFELEDLNGETWRLSSHLGQVVVINFWTTWCPPCRLEMPALQAAYERFGEDGFLVLAVNWTAVDDREAIEPYVEELGLTFPILLDTESRVSEELYNVLGLPTSVFVGRDGTVSEVFIGPIPLDQMEAKVDALLEENP